MATSRSANAQAEALLLLSSHVGMVTSLCLGFLTYSMLASLHFDYTLIRSLCKKRPTFVMFLNRLTYFTAKYIGTSYFVNGVVIGQEPHRINCIAASRYNQVTFYISLLANHWLFALRTLATWHGHKHHRLMLLFALAGLFSIIVGVILNVRTGKAGRVVEPFGCVYVVDAETLPDPWESGLLVALGLSYHTCNLVLAAMRLSSFAVTMDGEHSPASLWKRAGASFLAAVCGREKATSFRHSGVVLAYKLIKQGFHYWFMRFLSLIFFILVPIFSFQDKPTLVMSGLALFTAIDIELGGRIFRGTIIAMQEASRRELLLSNMSTDPLTSSPLESTTTQRECLAKHDDPLRDPPEHAHDSCYLQRLGQTPETKLHLVTVVPQKLTAIAAPPHTP